MKRRNPSKPKEFLKKADLQSEARGLDWSTLPVTVVLEHWNSDPQKGLSPETARLRLEKFGPNHLETVKKETWYGVFARQFVDILILILVFAAGVALLIGEIGDTITILGIVLLNGILGFVQEWKAERALAALRGMLSPRCQVLRGGRETEIDSSQLVPGDLVLLEIGDRVPADLRLIEALNLKVDESTLTGEALSIHKEIRPVAPGTPLAGRNSMVWMGTAVTNGRAKGVVVATGMSTEFGRIAKLTQTVGQESTPLQRKLSKLGKQLGLFSVMISIVVAGTGWLLGKPLLEMFMTGISLAVAVVPEGLPAVVTITLALGIRSMVKRRALLRRLQAAEALGSATIICTDKTGTLTQNEMTVQRIWLAAGEVRVTGVGYDPAGHFEQDGRKIDYRSRSDLLALLRTGLVCNHSKLNKDEDGWHEVGEPTEAALVVAAYKAWLQPDEEISDVTEFSFNSVRKRMTLIEQRPESYVAHVKGAPEIILERCSHILDGEKYRPMSQADREAFAAAYQEMARGGLRTLALARRELAPEIELKEEEVERDLTLLGVVGIMDPPRPEVSQAVRLSKSAGIRVLMITGDFAATAQAVAQKIGLEVEQVLTGKELDALDEGALQNLLRKQVLFARTAPEHKLRIVKALQDQGEVVGMTGDGVNDAPALKRADIGIAMGKKGTDVAKGAADMILTDDNFASIIGAVEEGRRQYDNIQKFVRYLLSSNTGEVLAIFVNILLGGPLILLPVQILWMNLVTDGMTAVALGLEPPERDVMDRPPIGMKQNILDWRGAIWIFLLGGYIGGGTLWLFHHYLISGGEQAIPLAQTVAFTGIIVLEKMNVFNFRSLREPMAILGFFSNPWVLLAWITTVGLQVAAVYLPFFQTSLHTVPLGWSEWGIIFLAAVPIFLLMEGIKWLGWLRRKR